MKKAMCNVLEEDLAVELERRKANECREEQNRKRICESSEELRRLKAKLHAAQVNKERHQQLCDQVCREEREKVEDESMDRLMEYERRLGDERELKVKIHKSQLRGKVVAINQQQIIAREEQKLLSLAQATEERKQVEEVVNEIARQDAVEEQTRRRKQDETKAMLKRFMKEQEERQRKMEQDEMDENAAIEAYAESKRAQEARIEAEKRAVEEEKRRIYESMVASATERDKEAEEMEYLRNELYHEELEEQQRRLQELAMRKKMEDRAEMAMACEQQLQMKERKREQQKIEDAAFAKQLMSKFAEDDRIEQLNDQKRRLKVQVHKREVERQIQIRGEMYEAERKSEIDMLAAQRIEEEKRLVVIEKERKRLLMEHAPAYKDYLPKGLFATREDRDMMLAAVESAGEGS